MVHGYYSMEGGGGGGLEWQSSLQRGSSCYRLNGTVALRLLEDEAVICILLRPSHCTTKAQFLQPQAPSQTCIFSGPFGARRKEAKHTNWAVSFDTFWFWCLKACGSHWKRGLFSHSSIDWRCHKQSQSFAVTHPEMLTSWSISARVQVHAAWPGSYFTLVPGRQYQGELWPSHMDGSEVFPYVWQNSND